MMSKTYLSIVFLVLGVAAIAGVVAEVIQIRRAGGLRAYANKKLQPFEKSATEGTLGLFYWVGSRDARQGQIAATILLLVVLGLSTFRILANNPDSADLFGLLAFLVFGSFIIGMVWYRSRRVAAWMQRNWKSYYAYQIWWYRHPLSLAVGLCFSLFVGVCLVVAGLWGLIGALIWPS